MELLTLPISAVSISGGTQSRVALNQDAVMDYADALRTGAEMPPVVVFNDGASDGLWLADGFHRFHAHRAAGLTEIDCDVRVGTQRDAVLFSVGANAAHGLRRTNDDKERAVMTLLRDAEWATWSQERIAKVCGVSAGYVSKLVGKLSLHGEEMKPAVRVVERNGKTYELDTSKIGKKVESDSICDAVQVVTVTTPAAGKQFSSASQELPAEQLTAPAPVNMPDGDSVELPDDEDHHVLAQLIEENTQLTIKAEALAQEISFLKQDDMVKQAAEWKFKFEQLAGRNRDLQDKAREAQVDAKRRGDLLAKIRTALGVVADAEILPAIGAAGAPQ